MWIATEVFDRRDRGSPHPRVGFHARQRVVGRALAFAFQASRVACVAQLLDSVWVHRRLLMRLVGAGQPDSALGRCWCGRAMACSSCALLRASARPVRGAVAHVEPHRGYSSSGTPARCPHLRGVPEGTGNRPLWRAPAARTVLTARSAGSAQRERGVQRGKPKRFSPLQRAAQASLAVRPP
jgi:hypothetical protein